MQEKNSFDMKNVHVLYAVLITVLAVGALVALVVQRSLLATETPTQTTLVGNSTPSFTSINTATGDLGSDITPSTGVTLTDAETKNMYIWGVANDNNGCDEIKSASSAWSMKFYRNDTTPGNCSSTNYTSCYQMGESPSGGSFAAATGTGSTNACNSTSDTDLAYEFVFPLKYFSPPTDSGTYSSNIWTAEVTVTDYNSSTASTADTIEMNSLTALDISQTTIDYGSLTVGDTSATSTARLATVANIGNTQLDLRVTGQALTCSISGSIAPSQVKYDDNSAPAYTSMDHTLSATASTIPAFNLAAQTTTSASSTKDVYWAINIPNGASGTCSNTVTLEAMPG